MILHLFLLLSALFFLASNIVADNLYSINTTANRTVINQLALMGAEPVHQDGELLLFLLPSDQDPKLNQSGLRVELLASGVDRDNLAVDTRLDRLNNERFTLVFEKEQYRLYSISEADRELPLRDYGLIPVGPSRPLTWIEPRTSVIKPEVPLPLDLDSLISLVSEDSLESYCVRSQQQ